MTSQSDNTLSKITEFVLEDFVIQCLEGQGYTYIPGPDIFPEGETPMRTSFEDVLLLEKVKAAIDRLNPGIPPAARADALKQIQRFHSPSSFAAKHSQTFLQNQAEHIRV